MKNLTIDKFREGMRVKCQIYVHREYNNRYDITDAKLHCENNRWYICQNVCWGSPCKNKLGYNYSWCIAINEKFISAFSKEVYNLRFDSLKDKLQILKQELKK